MLFFEDSEAGNIRCENEPLHDLLRRRLRRIRLPRGRRRRRPSLVATRDARDFRPTLGHELLEVAKVLLDPVEVVGDEVRGAAVRANHDHRPLPVCVVRDAVRVAAVADVAGECQLKP